MLWFAEPILCRINFYPGRDEPTFPSNLFQNRQGKCLPLTIRSFEYHCSTAINVDVAQKALYQAFCLAEANGKLASATVERWQSQHEVIRWLAVRSSQPWRPVLRLRLEG